MILARPSSTVVFSFIACDFIRQHRFDPLATATSPPRRRPARWVWVYHWPPLGSPTCWTGKRFYGDADIGGWIDQFQPDMVLTGHVHEPPFKPDGAWADRLGPTWVFNAGRQIGPVPAHIEIDLNNGDVVWQSMMGSESLRLSDAARPARSVF